MKAKTFSRRNRSRDRRGGDKPEGETLKWGEAVTSRQDGGDLRDKADKLAGQNPEPRTFNVERSRGGSPLLQVSESPLLQVSQSPTLVTMRPEKPQTVGGRG